MSLLPNWTLAQYQAAGRHVLSYGAGAATMAAAWGLISAHDAAGITDNLSTIWDGLMEVGKGVAGLAATYVSIRAGWIAAHQASPKTQIESVVKNLSVSPTDQGENGAVDPEGRKKIIDAVAEMPEVEKIVAPAVARELGPKVVAQ